MNRADLQTLAITRFEEARSLLAAGHPSGAYYLAGYAVECALKAVIASQTQLHDFPDRKRALDSFVHDLSQLMNVAGLADPFQKQIKQSPALGTNWRLVRDWSEGSRYLIYDHDTARLMLFAVSDAENGVLSWITQYW